MKLTPLLVLLPLAALASVANAQTKLLRFPDIHGERVTFCYAGDLWTAPSVGGTATRLTSHPGLELFPKFSPDGRWIAFTGQYEGDEQVYVIPAVGGTPEQLTFYPARGPLPQRWGFDNQVYGWSKDSSSVLFRSMREGWDLTDTRLYLVPRTGGPAKPLPMPVSGGGDLAPDEKRAVYSPLTRDFRTWKRYQGGWAQDLYIFDFATSQLTPVASHVRTERDPMWLDDTTIAFASDRDGTLNLYSFDTRSSEVAQLTNSKTWDVRWPSKGEDGEIVYESDGELWVLDRKRGANRKLDIVVPDDGVSSRPAHTAVGDQIEEFGLSPKGERALFVAHGDVFTAPIEHGATRNLTNTSKAHERAAEWSPDGAWIAYVSDVTGEEEVWIVPQDGSAPAEQLTQGGDRRIDGLRFSPDSKRISIHDKSGRLRVLDRETKAITEVARNPAGGMGDYTWSPDSRWIALTLGDPNGFGSLYVWSVEDGVLHRVTDELWNEREPAWDPKGEYLYFLSDRSYTPQLFAGLEWNFAINRTTGVFALALRRDVAHPLPHKSDEVALESKDKEKEPAKDGEGAKEETKAPKPIGIDFDGLGSRVARLPIEADNYGGIVAAEGQVFVMRAGAPYYGRESERPTSMHCFNFEDRKFTEVVAEHDGIAFSHDRSKLMFAHHGEFTLRDAKPGEAEGKHVSTAELYVDRVPRDEWATIFDEVWRRFRDYFYVENMHGYDWKALREQYRQLVPHVGHRSDLNYVMGELVAELNVGHAYVSGGEWVAPARPQVALLGARLEWDAAAQAYRITRILKGHNEEPRYRSPLTEIGVDVREGEYLLAVDGQPLTGDVDPYRVLRHRAAHPIELTVVATPADRSKARKVRITPITSENDLNYLNWVLARREIVERLSGGRLAYLHIPDMGEDGIAEFIKWYYGQVRKDGLIVDDRNNGGGNVSQMVIERLRRTLLSTGFARNSDFTETYPSVVFTGPMACLLNENSASDGDIFPWMFRTAGLGPLIGKRSWGGVVGITSHGPLLDGGTVNVPEFGNNDRSGAWAVEGHGVDPDIVVENDPASVIAGRDPQLERAIAEVLKAAEQRKAALPVRPTPPVKTK